MQKEKVVDEWSSNLFQFKIHQNELPMVVKQQNSPSSLLTFCPPAKSTVQSQ